MDVETKEKLEDEDEEGKSEEDDHDDGAGTPGRDSGLERDLPFTFLYLQMILTRRRDLVNQVQLEVQILFGELWRRNYSRKNLHADSTPAGSEVTPMDCIWSIAKFEL